MMLSRRKALAALAVAPVAAVAVPPNAEAAWTEYGGSWNTDYEGAQIIAAWRREIDAAVDREAQEWLALFERVSKQHDEDMKEWERIHNEWRKRAEAAR